MSQQFDQFGPSEEPFSSPYEAKAEPQRKSGCLKYFILTVLACLLATIACCVGGFLYLRSGVITDPQAAQALADEMIDWEFNEELPVVFGVDVFFVKMAMLVEPEEGIIMMVQSRFIPDEEVGKEVEAQVRSQLDMGSNDDMEETVVIEPGERTIEVKGREVVFTFNKTEGRKSGKFFWEVVGVLPGEPYPIVLIMEVRDDIFSADMIEQRLRSIP